MNQEKEQSPTGHEQKFTEYVRTANWLRKQATN